MASGNEMKAHEAQYESFLTLVKVTIPVLAVIAAVVIKLIA